MPWLAERPYFFHAEPGKFLGIEAISFNSSTSFTAGLAINFMQPAGGPEKYCKIWGGEFDGAGYKNINTYEPFVINSAQLETDAIAEINRRGYGGPFPPVTLTSGALRQVTLIPLTRMAYFHEGELHIPYSYTASVTAINTNGTWNTGGTIYYSFSFIAKYTKELNSFVYKEILPGFLFPCIYTNSTSPTGLSMLRKAGNFLFWVAPGSGNTTTGFYGEIFALNLDEITATRSIYKYPSVDDPARVGYFNPLAEVGLNTVNQESYNLMPIEKDNKTGSIVATLARAREYMATLETGSQAVEENGSFEYLKYTAGNYLSTHISIAPNNNVAGSASRTSREFTLDGRATTSTFNERNCNIVFRKDLTTSTTKTLTDFLPFGLSTTDSNRWNQPLYYGEYIYYPAFGGHVKFNYI